MLGPCRASWTHHRALLEPAPLQIDGTTGIMLRIEVTPESQRQLCSGDPVAGEGFSPTTPPSYSIAARVCHRRLRGPTGEGGTVLSITAEE